MVDRGAGINLAKRNKTVNAIQIGPRQRFSMGRDKYETNEYVTKRIFGQDHIFHIVPDNFPIIEDGIIGLPCLEKYNYSISNDRIRLNDKTILFQKPIQSTPGENRVQTIYLEGKPTKVCFINTGEQNIEISNNIQNSHYVSNVSKLKSLVRTDHIEKPIRGIHRKDYSPLR